MRKKTFFKIVITLLLIAIAGAVYFFVLKDKLNLTTNFKKPWQAVYLNNNQIYFGHISEIENGTILLSDVYTLQSYQEPMDVATSEHFAIGQPPKQAFKLVKKGGDKIITTDNSMTINLASVVYWEKLTSDSQVVRLIEEGK